MRVLHVSDLHVSKPFRSAPLSEWMGKRLVGGLNFLLGRGQHYADAESKIAALDAFRREQGVDLVICTGDFTAFGTKPEIEAARRAVDPLAEAPLGLVTVPGNHDLYTRYVLLDMRFDKAFGDLMTTDLPELVTDGRWPWVRLFGDDLAVVAVNSARPRPIWSSSGRIPQSQIAGLRNALADPRVANRFVFVITHYAPCIEDGAPDIHRHGLENVRDYLAACEGVERGAMLCGHIHRRYVVQPPILPLPLYCAGSTTKAGREGLWLFDFDGSSVRARPGHWNGTGYALEE